METHFGKYKLIERIGGGRLSQVYRVSSEALGEQSDPRVALKRVHPEVIGESAFVRLVVREAGVLTRLKHPYLCECFELGVIDGSAFLTLSLVDGCTLRALMRRLSQMGVKLPVSAIRAIGCQLTEVLEYLHGKCSHPVVHLDLSPQNVMLSRDGTLRLIDFGISHYLDGHNPPPLGGKIAGTVGYMSPEQASGGAIDARADQYGMGILLWEMLAGARLFQGNTPETWERMRSGAIPPVKVAMKSVPDSLADLVYQLLAADPNDRFEDTEDTLEAFHKGSSNALSGTRPLAALVQRLLNTPSFDPFDVVKKPPAHLPGEEDVPTGEDSGGEESSDLYEELSIEVDQGMDSPASQVRAVLPDSDAPQSPFLELDETPVEETD